MSKTLREEPSAEDRQVRGYVSVSPDGLVVSTGSGTKEEMAGNWQGTISLTDRESGLAVQLDHDAALKLAASLLRACSFLREAETPGKASQNSPIRVVAGSHRPLQ